MTEVVYDDDEGTTFEITVTEDGVALDVSTSSVKQIRFRMPDNSVLTKTALFKTDGTDGIIKYTTVAGDIDQVGTWGIQAYVEIGSGKWSSQIERFEVLKKIE